MSRGLPTTVCFIYILMKFLANVCRLHVYRLITKLNFKTNPDTYNDFSILLILITEQWEL